ncbi:hypothetical protein [Ktedonospora formicarum]|uniref:hypothetical protein n=1 Tax=Ktedonospora formicarum TaxID=2778364 RepID=UPI001C68E77A|nr:hypothetical protein [Ktedonospora formicarum]
MQHADVVPFQHQMFVYDASMNSDAGVPALFEKTKERITSNAVSANGLAIQSQVNRSLLRDKRI